MMLRKWSAPTTFEKTQGAKHFCTLSFMTEGWVGGVEDALPIYL